jgi:hypothetical protein
MFRLTHEVRFGAVVVGALLLFPWLVVARQSRSTRLENLSLAPPAASVRVNADLTGEARPDDVALLSYGFFRNIEIQFRNSRSRNTNIRPHGVRRGFLIPYDVDHDRDLDLIWVASDKRNFVVCINDGYANFHVAKNSAHYASQIKALLNDGDSHDPQSLNIQRNDRSLSASPSSKVALAASRWLGFAPEHPTLISERRKSTRQLHFLDSRSERGPPRPFLN